MPSRDRFYNRLIAQPIFDPETRQGRTAIGVAARVVRVANQTRNALRGGPAPDLRVDKLASAERGFVFHTVPKVASTSMTSLLREGADAPSDITWFEATPAEATARYPGAFNFAIVRNPWARAWSAYQDKIWDVNTIGKLRIITRFRGLRPRMPFAEFVEWLGTPEGSDASADRHWISQHRILPLDGEAKLDLVVKLEALKEGLAIASEKTRIDFGQLSAKNSSREPKGGGYRDRYDARLRDLVAKRYARDVELLGYDF